MMRQMFYRGCNTDDGEHPNLRGMKIIAKLYANVLRTWMTHTYTVPAL
jgi:hypothetical protein